MVTGAIAYRDVQTTSPPLAARVVAILRQHPEYQQRWASKLNDPMLSEDDRNQYLFMLAARWPDDVRGKAYDHSTWHYVNYIYAPEQGIARTDTTLAAGEMLQAFEQNRQILRSTAPDSAKAIALCWLFHLAGDVHMPLHTMVLVDKQFPQVGRDVKPGKVSITQAQEGFARYLSHLLRHGRSLLEIKPHSKSMNA